MQSLRNIAIENMISSRGNVIANQFIITTSECKIFQSYKSTIAIVYNYWRVALDKIYRNYSRTTSKYRNHFLWETWKETQKKIDSWEYELKDLN